MSVLGCVTVLFLYNFHLMQAGTSPPVISTMNLGSGLKSMTWKCSTASTDLRLFQFLNHMTFVYISHIVNPQNLEKGYNT